MNVTVPCRDAGVAAEVCAAGAAPFGGVEPRLIPAAAFNASLNAALAATPDLMRQVRRTDGVLKSSWITTRAIPVSSDYMLQLRIYRETVAMDGRVNADFLAGAGVGPAD